MPVQKSTGVSRAPQLPLLMEAPTDPNNVSHKIHEKWALDTVTPYVQYTPVITGTSGGFAYGTGAFQLGRYKRFGPNVQIEILIFFGNPGFVPGGNTVWNFSLPVLPFFSTGWTQKHIGTAFFNQGLANIQDLHACIAFSPAARTFQIPVSGAAIGQMLTGTVPAKGQGAFLECNIRYECLP